MGPLGKERLLQILTERWPPVWCRERITGYLSVDTSSPTGLKFRVADNSGVDGDKRVFPIGIYRLPLPILPTFLQIQPGSFNAIQVSEIETGPSTRKGSAAEGAQLFLETNLLPAQSHCGEI